MGGTHPVAGKTNDSKDGLVVEAVTSLFPTAMSLIGSIPASIRIYKAEDFIRPRYNLN